RGWPVRLRDQARQPLQHPEPEIALAVAEGGVDIAVGQAVTRGVMLDPPRRWIEPVHAAARTEIDAPPLIFDHTAHTVAGDAIGFSVSLETERLRPRVINAAQAAQGASNPQ